MASIDAPGGEDAGLLASGAKRRVVHQDLSGHHTVAHQDPWHQWEGLVFVLLVIHILALVFWSYVLYKERSRKKTGKGGSGKVFYKFLLQVQRASTSTASVYMYKDQLHLQVTSTSARISYKYKEHLPSARICFSYKDKYHLQGHVSSLATSTSSIYKYQV
eukprot:gene4392-14518_t